MIDIINIYENYYMRYGVAIFGYIWLFIFAFHIIQSDSVSGVSILAIFIAMAVATQWLVYGTLKNDKAVQTGGLIAILGNVFIISAYIYKRTSKSITSRQ